MYYGHIGWHPGGRVNAGELIEPPLPLPSLALTRFGDGTTDPNFLRGKWTFLYVASGGCADACRTRLYDTRQVRIALDRDMNRVQRVFIADPECCDAQFLHDQHPDLITLRADAAAAPLLTLLSRSDASSSAGTVATPAQSNPPRGDLTRAGLPRVYLIDPLGNLMMSYPAQAKSKGMLEDMKRLLRLSLHRLTHASATAIVLVQAPRARRCGAGGGRGRAGAWVRLTDAGLGCPDWPGCYGHVFPQASHADSHAGFQFGKALHEMIHRYFAGTLIIIITALLVWAAVFRKDRDQPLIPVALLFVVVCLQAALGALTVTQLLKPLIVTAHLFGGLSTMGLLCWLSQAPQTRQLTVGETSLRKYALVGLAALVLQIGLGGWTSTNYAAVACPDLPTCQQSLVAAHGLSRRLCSLARSRYRL